MTSTADRRAPAPGDGAALYIDVEHHRIEPRPDRRPAVRATWMILALGLCGSTMSMTFTLVLPLLAELPAILGASADDVAWVSTATLLTGTIATPVFGRLGDLYGKRRLALASISCCIAGSLLGAVATSLAVLVAARGLQGLGIAVIPLGISIARDELPADKVGSGIALVSASLGIGNGVGMPLAGFLTEAFDWHSVFWFSAGQAGLSLIAVLAVVPESPIRAEGRFDAVGSVGLMGVLTCILLPISKGSAWGWTSPLTIGLGLAAVAGALAWTHHALRARSPVVDLRSMARGPVLKVNLTGLALGFAMFAVFYGTVIHLQIPDRLAHGFGASLVYAGTLLVPGALAMVVMSPMSARMSAAYGPRVTLSAGALVVSAGYGVLLTVLDSLVVAVAGVVVVNVGVGLAYGAMPALVMAYVPVWQTGSANAVNALFRAGGSAVASAVGGVILASLVVELDGLDYPSADALRALFGMGGAAAVVASALALLLPAVPHADLEEIS
jgi:MFS family permease